MVIQTRWWEWKVSIRRIDRPVYRGLQVLNHNQGYYTLCSILYHRHMLLFYNCASAIYFQSSTGRWQNLLGKWLESECSTCVYTRKTSFCLWGGLLLMEFWRGFASVVIEELLYTSRAHTLNNLFGCYVTVCSFVHTSVHMCVCDIHVTSICELGPIPWKSRRVAPLP